MLTKSHTEQAKMETIPERSHGQESEDKKHLDMLTKSHMFLGNCSTNADNLSWTNVELHEMFLGKCDTQVLLLEDHQIKYLYQSFFMFIL